MLSCPLLLDEPFLLLVCRTGTAMASLMRVSDGGLFLETKMPWNGYGSDSLYSPLSMQPKIPLVDAQ